MPKAAFTTLGCKVNQYETQRILDSFEGAGFEVVPFDAIADVYVINTCSVTSIAESKSRYTVRRANRLNPDAKVVVTGCAAQMTLNKGESFEGADVLIENPAKLETLSRFMVAYPEFGDRLGGAPASPKIQTGRTRATLKIQDGCSVMCSYCSIPFTRPGMSSRAAPEILDEAERMAEMGYREIILTGVLIGAYGPETGSGGPGFEELISLLQSRLEPFAPFRLRISSIEMRQVTESLLQAIASPNTVPIVPHLHIPLQSGSTSVLKDMNRPYSQTDFIDLCKRARATVPNLAITTDIMVGFPTETDERFEETLEVCDAVRFSKIHAFRFSPRFGTPADAWGDPIPPQVKQERSKILGERSARFASEFAQGQLGKTVRVLVEGKPTKEGLLEGLTDNYVTVHFAGSPSLARSFVWVRLEEEREGIAFGERVESPSKLVMRST